MDPNTKEQTLVVRNENDIAVRFLFEPWGQVYELPAGAVFRVIARGPDDGDFEVEVGDGCIAVYGWVGCTARLFHEARELPGERWDRFVVPPVPEGMTVRDFVNLMR